MNCNNSSVNNFINWEDILLKLLDNPTIASKRWIYQQYDHQVQLNTVLPPGGGDAAVIRLRPQEGENSLSPTQRGVAAVVDCPNRWVYLDPERGSMAAVVEAARNLSCVGANPLAVTDNLNFSSPDEPFGYWQLAMACRGLTTACKFMETPVTGGNVSLYNETRSEDGVVQPIHPTPVVGMVGLVDDLSIVCGQGWKKPGDSIWLLGLPLEITKSFDSRITLSATSYLESIHHKISGRPPEIDLELERQIQNFLRNSISERFVSSAHDVSDGGLAVAIAECCISSGLGVELLLPKSDVRLDRLLFAEGGARILVSVSPERLSEWRKALDDFYSATGDSPLAQHLGQVSETQELLITQSNVKLVHISINKIQQQFENAIPRRLGKKTFSNS